MPTNWGAIAPAGPRRDYMKGQPNKEKTIAYCRYYKHLGALSKTMVKQHECIQKNCKYFEKNLDNPYWQRRSAYTANKKREKKLRKFIEWRDQRGTKEVTGNLLTVSSSDINTDMSSMLEFFNSLEVFHVYVFYQERLMRMRHLGGFYGMDIAMQKTMENIRNEKWEYVVIVSETREPIGFRVLEKNRNLVEVDLTWGRLYPALRHLAEENFFVDIRKEA